MKYSVLKGFAGVNKDGVKTYFSPENQHLVGDLPAAEISKHLKAGNIAEIDPKSLAAAKAAEEAGSSATPETASAKKSARKGGSQ